MAGSFHYTLGINELKTKKTEFWRALTGEFIGEYLKAHLNIIRRISTFIHDQTSNYDVICIILLLFPLLSNLFVHRVNPDKKKRMNISTNSFLSTKMFH